ncbi:MAG: DUF2726 domain-containing protein [Burkholderiaceae bacterium]|nr:MAG: DUF2726 domain-containing protein [Burkholderiaceae bacterium]
MQPMWIWVVSGIVLVLIVLLYLKFIRVPSPRNDRYTSEALLTPALADLLHYLQTVFPSQAVLANVPLNRIVSIRRAANRRRARKALDTMRVNFAVCDKAGKATFVFDVEAYHKDDASVTQRGATQKNRILKSAGVRLIYIKDTTRSMPSPDEFRLQLSLASLSRSERAAHQVSVRQQLERRMAKSDKNFKPSGFKESEVMGMSKLMDLSPDSQVSALDPWAASRS